MYNEENISINIEINVNNTHILSLIESDPHGIIAMLEDEMMLPQGNPERLRDKMFVYIFFVFFNILASVVGSKN